MMNEILLIRSENLVINILLKWRQNEYFKQSTTLGLYAIVRDLIIHVLLSIDYLFTLVIGLFHENLSAIHFLFTHL